MIKALLLATLLSAPIAQAQAAPKAPDQSKLLENIRTRYDLPWRSGLTSFACTVQFDWIAHLTQSLHRPVPATDPIVKALTTSHATVRVNASGPTVSTSFQNPQPPSAAQGLAQSLENVLTSGLNGWLPFSTGSILPVGKTNYLILPTEDGYRIDLSGEEIVGSLDLDPNYAIRHSTSKLNTQTVHLDTTFTPSPKGYELTHVHTITTPADPAKHPTDGSLDVTYQTVYTTSIPQTLAIQSKGGDLWTIRLSGCSTTP
jgi:hypothetical protein